MLSEIAPNVQLGVMICLCLLTCAVTTLLLIPSLLKLWKVVTKRHKKHKTEFFILCLCAFFWLHFRCVSEQERERYEEWWVGQGHRA